MRDLVLGTVAVVLACVSLAVFVANRDEDSPTPVLVANRLIPKGTPGDVIARTQMYTVTEFPAKEVENAAIADPQYLRGRAVVVDILPGEQLIADDFSLQSG